MKPNEIKLNQMKSREINWKQMKSSETKQNQVKSNEIEWNQMTSSETKWNQLKSFVFKWNPHKINETKWNQVKSTEISWMLWCLDCADLMLVIHDGPKSYQRFVLISRVWSKWVQVKPGESKVRPSEFPPTPPIPPILLSNFSWLYRYIE